MKRKENDHGHFLSFFMCCLLCETFSLTHTEYGIAFDAGNDGNNFGGPTESPFVVRRGSNFYLFTGDFNLDYHATRVYLSQVRHVTFSHIIRILSTLEVYHKEPQRKSVRFFPMRLKLFEISMEVGMFPLQVNTEISSFMVLGWGQGGLYLSELIWMDGLDNESTSMPIPQWSEPIAPKFHSNLTDWIKVGDYSEWTETPGMSYNQWSVS